MTQIHITLSLDQCLTNFCELWCF